jgi:hypothetical protein
LFSRAYRRHERQLAREQEDAGRRVVTYDDQRELVAIRPTTPFDMKALWASLQGPA